MTIDQLRGRIDELDARLVVLLNERAACALELGRLKEAMGLEIYQPGREREVLSNVRSLNRGPLQDDAVVRLFERIIDEARRLEREAKEQGRAQQTADRKKQETGKRSRGAARLPSRPQR